MTPAPSDAGRVRSSQRRPAGALTDAVRETILERAWQLFDLEEADVLSSHVDADYLADTRRLVGDVSH